MKKINCDSLDKKVVAKISKNIAGKIKDNIHEIRFGVCYDKNGEIIKEECEATKYLEKEAVKYLFNTESNIITGIIKVENRWYAEVSCDFTHNIEYVKVADA